VYNPHETRHAHERALLLARGSHLKFSEAIWRTTSVLFEKMRWRAGYASHKKPTRKEKRACGTRREKGKAKGVCREGRGAVD
jgi:hypothetical protein